MTMGYGVTYNESIVELINISNSFMFGSCIRNHKLIGHYVYPSAPGGTLSDEVTSTEVCLFKAQEDMETMQAYAQVTASTPLPRNRQFISRIVKRHPLLLSRFLTNSSGATSTWRKVLKRRLRRFVPRNVFSTAAAKTRVLILFGPEEKGDVSVSAAAAVSQGLHRVWAHQAGHANRDSAGQWQHLCIHSQQPF